MTDTHAAWDRLRDSLAMLPGWSAAQPQLDAASGKWSATARNERHVDRAQPRDILTASGDTEHDAVDRLARLVWLRATV